MEESLKFNSQICTTKEQSQRLLDLGLKPETADMNWTIVDDDREGNSYSVEYKSIGRGKYQLLHPDWYIPAWSLHRLIELYSDVEDTSSLCIKDISYKLLIFCIEKAIHCGFFNREYLKQ